MAAVPDPCERHRGGEPIGTLIQTENLQQCPVVLLGTSYWRGLVEWLTETLPDAGAIAARGRGLLLVTDDPVVAIEQLWACHLTLCATLGPGPHYPESLAAGMEVYHGNG